jgi:hypothetical protein
MCITLIIFVVALSGCSTPSIPSRAKLPAIPSSGWTVDESKHRSWHRGTWQIADYNADGRIDYIRIPDPPKSYNHRIWIDRDYDGRFEEYSDIGGKIKIDLPVPAFEPANKRSTE